MYLGRFAAATSVFYAHNFFDPVTGEDIDPATPAARQRTPAGVWSDLTAPAKQDGKTGFYGGTIDTTGYANGQYIIRITGDPASGVTQSGLFCFEIGPGPADLQTIKSQAVTCAAGVTVLASVGTAATSTAQTGDAFARIGATGSGLTSLMPATAGLLIKKNVELANFEFALFSSTDHATPQAGMTVTATRSIDGAAFAACANAVVEVGSGVYKITLAAADLNGTVITFKFAATGADTRLITIITQA